MAETHTLTVPLTLASVTTYRIAEINLNWDDALIGVVTVDSSNTKKAHQYSGATATTLMVALNKANLTVKSLHKRVLEQLAADGKILAGSVTGTPD